MKITLTIDVPDVVTPDDELERIDAEIMTLLSAEMPTPNASRPAQLATLFKQALAVVDRRTDHEQAQNALERFAAAVAADAAESYERVQFNALVQRYQQRLKQLPGLFNTRHKSTDTNRLQQIAQEHHAADTLHSVEQQVRQQIRDHYDRELESV